MLLLVAGCAKSTESGIEVPADVPTLEFLKGLNPGPAIEEPAKLGRRCADADIGNGTLRILVFGLPSGGGGPPIDEETGYPEVRVAGCIVSSDFVVVVGAYNSAMREHFRAQ